MTASDNPAITTAQAFVNYQQSIASRLRYGLAQINLRECHELSNPLTVLDAGGGNGIHAEFLLSLGHQVTIYDADPEMLAQARTRIEAQNLLPRCQFVQGKLEAIAGTLPDGRYDLVVCHHVLEYIDDGLGVLQSLHGLTASNGELSLTTLNPVSEVLRAVVFQQNPAQAVRKLSDLNYDARWFGHARLYSLEDILARAEKAGWHLKDFRGIRILADYVQEPTALSHEADLMRLEAELGRREPFRRIGRYLQCCFGKP